MESCSEQEFILKCLPSVLTEGKQVRKGKASPVERTVLLTDQTDQSTQSHKQGGILSKKCVKLTLIHSEATDFIDNEATSLS